MKYLLFFVIIFMQSQTINVLSKERDSLSLRGLAVANEKEFWVSSSKGFVGYTKDAGATFQWKYYSSYQNNEFRDIVLTKGGKIYVLAITQPAEIIEINKRNQKYKVAYSDPKPEAFIDAISCYEEQCKVIGDAVDPHQFYLVSNAKKEWQLVKFAFPTEEGEAYFAASGGNIVLPNKDDFLVVSGGKSSRLFYTYKNIEKVQSLPIRQGEETTGANAIAFEPMQEMGIIVGGDFMKPTESMFNICIIQWNSSNKEFDFSFPQKPPDGYQSSVEYLGKQNWVCCGLNGVYYSNDNGVIWRKISDQKFHVVRKISENKAILAGPKGVIAELRL